jgi:hypothetical protein
LDGCFLPQFHLHATFLSTHLRALLRDGLEQIEHGHLKQNEKFPQNVKFPQNEKFPPFCAMKIHDA